MSIGFFVKLCNNIIVFYPKSISKIKKGMVYIQVLFILKDRIPTVFFYTFFTQKLLIFYTTCSIMYLGGEEMLDKLKECSEIFYNFATPIATIVTAILGYKAVTYKKSKRRRR